MWTKPGKPGCLLALCLLIAAATQPARAVEMIPVSTVAALEQALREAEGRATLVRVRSNKNLSDSELDEVYASECVVDMLADIRLLTVDASEDSADVRSLKEALGVSRAPWAVVFDPEGRRVADSDILGYLSPYRFAERVKDALNPPAMPDSCVPGDID